MAHNKKHSEKAKELIRKSMASESKPVVQYSIYGNGEIINVFSSIHQASRETGINRKCISMACHKTQSRAGFYNWKFA